MIYHIFFIILLAGALWCAWRISVADWRRRIIPDAYLFPLMLIGLIVLNFFPWPVAPYDAVVAAACGYALTSVIGVAFDARQRRRNPNANTPIGMGDIKLIAAGGLWLGTWGLSIALVIACISAMIWGARQHQRFIPFAPFFIIGGILALIIIGFLL